MIAYLPTIYPDELVYSWFCRYYVHSGCFTHKMVLQELYCNRSDNPSKEFIGNLKPEARAEIAKMYPLDMLTLNHTLFPQYARFIPLEQRKNALYHIGYKVWLVILAIILIGFILWKIIGPKTVESGDGWKHQVYNFKEECDFSDYCQSNGSTHRIHHMFGTYGYYCDECWETYGQDYFDRLAEKDSKNSNSDEARNAKICAVKAVEDSLKSPSTADFCNYNDMTATNLGGDKWKVTGYVDAQNSFGATLRENWTVTLTLTGSGFKDYTVTFD